MYRLVLATLTLTSATLLAGCPPPRLDTDVIDVTLSNPKDAWSLSGTCTDPVLLFTCPSGIGSATVHLAAPGPALRFSAGLRYAKGEPFTRLEGFQVTAGEGGSWTDPPRRGRFGYLEVTLPEGAFEPGNDVLTIDWVDTYR